jgi:hypothetical protein
MIRLRLVFFPLLFFVLFFSSCKRQSSNDLADITVHRFDQELFSLDIYAFQKGAIELIHKYPKFISLFSNRIIEIGDTTSERYYDNLLTFTTDQAVYNMYKSTEKVYMHFEPYKTSLDEVFGQFKKYFPQQKLPEVYTYVSGFNQSIVTTEDFVGVSLEKYLGNRNPLYDELSPALANYERCRMNPSNLVPDIVRAWIVTSFDNSKGEDNLLAGMIREGRSYYVLSKLMPQLPDSILWGFSEKKIKFCKESEKEMWTFLIENKLLFSTDQFRIGQFLNDGPFTKDFTRDSPAKASVWIGYRIVDNYMKHNKNITLPALMMENDFQNILTESRYNP